MIKYLGIRMSTRPFAGFSLFEEVQFEVSLLNTIQDKRFVLKIRCSSACITGKAFIAPEIIKEKSKAALKYYSRRRKVALNPDLDSLLLRFSMRMFSSLSMDQPMCPVLFQLVSQ